ncbi:MAG: HigA family addiction module antitoxin [Nitrospirota bacterium]|nr:HigA family addiction module antitoxin [Nitrospirota bacterium]
MSKFGDPIHPGEILVDELEFIGITASVLADKIDVPKNRMYQIINRQRSVTADTALRLAQFFGTSPDFWMNLQKSYELDVERQKVRKKIESIIPYAAAS